MHGMTADSPKPPLPRGPLPKGLARRSLRAVLAATFVVLAVTACTHQPARWPAGPGTGHAVGSDIRVSACREALATARAAVGTGLDGAGIRLVNWNIQKKHSPAWRDDFERLAADADFVLMQEASLGHHVGPVLTAGRYAAFAPGYRTSQRVTGVLTLSRHEPLVRCSFTSREPWLRTPKSTGITAYGLAGADETLVVVNIHALNFALGLSDYRAQLSRILDVLHDHSGPIILAGDFNTWRGRRQGIVTELASALGLQAVTFTEDERVRVFGLALDHIYVRDLELRQSGTDSVSTSDHNPMTAVPAMPYAAP
jgi:endonuclease/exonuclease/phosphatase (EEP) superfamily protein YafD